MTIRPERKPNRLQTYDYQTPGYYFLTFCTADRACLLGHITEADETRRSFVILSEAGVVVDKVIRSISAHYPSVSLEHFQNRPAVEGRNYKTPGQKHLADPFPRPCDPQRTGLPGDLAVYRQQSHKVVSGQVLRPLIRPHP